MWILLALLTAAGTAVRDAASKHATRALDPIVVGCGISAIPAALLGAWILGAGLLGGAPVGLAPRHGFGLALVVSGGINAVTTPLIIWALKRSDLSLMAPLTSVTPLFMIPVAALVLGEAPSVVGGVGVAVIVAGAYLLNLSDRDAGPMAPFAALARDPGARAMLLVALLYSISGTYDKVGTQASSPLVWAAALQATIALLLAPLAVWRWRKGREVAVPAGPTARPPGRSTGSRRAALSPAAAVALAGGVSAVAAAAQMTALTLTLVAYVIAVKRTSTLFSVLLGRSVFREEGTAQRFVGAGVMLIGFVLVTLH